jgi:hypothetical protein
VRGSETGCTAPACHEDWEVQVGQERLCVRHHQARCDAQEAAWLARRTAYLAQRTQVVRDVAELDCVYYAAPRRGRLAEEET